MVLILSACASTTAPDPGRGDPPPGETTDAPAHVFELELPVTISHRGGALVHPEESMEGFTASARDGFLPEMDINFLADGTPVLIHDSSVDRTLNGVNGRVRDLSLEDWESATIKNPTGGPEAETVTLDEVLDELGGEVVLVPEIKPGATPEEVDQVLDEFDDRGLEDSLIVQSFDWDAATTIADRGYTSLYLFGTELPPEPLEKMVAAGIDWIGPSARLPRRDMEQLIESDLHVAPYGLTVAQDAHDLPGGISGFFVDDPWSK
ncbi:glycerophosphodiester phosphodiesterase [Janibacter alittae]|uniref:Glycerophosphodiester phosphodiesterase n=1 Tax=Janibacter alittae TaxID=3115209 RepID=A0ABZ2MJX7_9MICO